MQTEIEALFDNPPESYGKSHFTLFERFREGLNAGRIRAAITPCAGQDLGRAVIIMIGEG